MIDVCRVPSTDCQHQPDPNQSNTCNVMMVQHLTDHVRDQIIINNMYSVLCKMTDICLSERDSGRVPDVLVGLLTMSDINV